MTNEGQPGRSTRRAFLGLSAAAAVLIGPGHGRARSQPVRPTPTCGEDGHATPPQTEGPYWKPSSPLRASLLEPGTKGRKLVVEGVVMTTACAPLPRAIVDFWQADDAGRYDNRGFHLRGHQLTDDAGRYRLETVIPGAYPGRTRHIHVKVQTPGGRPLTTQLYFPDEPMNQRDGIFDADLLVRLAERDGLTLATFDFVLDSSPGRPRAR